MEEREEATMRGVQEEVKGKRKERKKEERGKVVGARNGSVARGDGVLKIRGSKEVEKGAAGQLNLIRFGENATQQATRGV